MCARKSEDKVSEHCLTKLFVIASIDNLYHFLGYYKSQLKRTREEAESEARILWNEVKKLRMMTEILAERMNRLEWEERERHDSTERRDRERERPRGEERRRGSRSGRRGRRSRRRESFKRERDDGDCGKSECWKGEEEGKALELKGLLIIIIDF